MVRSVHAVSSGKGSGGNSSSSKEEERGWRGGGRVEYMDRQ